MASNEQRDAVAGRWLGLAFVLVLLGLALYSYREICRPLASYQLASGTVAQPRRLRTTGKNPVWYVEFQLAGRLTPFQLEADSLALLERLQAVADPYHLTRVYFRPAAFDDKDFVMQLENDRLGGVLYSLHDARQNQTSDLVLSLLMLAVAAPLVLRPWLAQIATFFE